MINKLLAIDIGNSRISMALFEDDKLTERTDFRVQQIDLAIVYLVNKIRQLKSVFVAISSVVPSLSKKVLASTSNLPVYVMELNPKNQRLISNLYSGIGIDRVANAAAAINSYKNKDTLAIIDFGTATTLTVVESSGKFLGGLITLGLTKTYKAIANFIDQLPEVDLDGLKIASPLAFDTTRAIANGCFLAHLGAIDYWINTVRSSVDKNVYVIGTGGFVQVISGFCSGIDSCNLDLTLWGIKYLAQSQSQSSLSPPLI